MIEKILISVNSNDIKTLFEFMLFLKLDIQTQLATLSITGMFQPKPA